MAMFPQFPQFKVLVFLVDGLTKDAIANIQKQLADANPEYDYCFCSTTYIVSLEQLHHSIHNSLQSYTSDQMQTRTLNAEILLNLCPVNVISEALKRFGISEACSSAVIIKILGREENTIEVERFTQSLGTVVPITDDALYQRADIAKFKKVYKLNDAEDPSDLTRLAIGASILRGC
ncbi:uncharacterized protein LODBEIA_P56980 [Lodderomyces beijingensis]|uniref:EKC/KEOPS complex subunit CGI121 n=1 Tax=Lodderomyces beijingensis TaxID=1775926 RepID=A0ABP0ZNI4_9ASCO